MPDSIPVYVGTYTNDASEGIHLLSVDPTTGALDHVGRAATVYNPFFLVANAARNILYATVVCDTFEDEPSGAIAAFAIRPEDGNLAEIGRQSARGKVPCYLDLTRDSAHLLVANYGSGSLAVLPVDFTGALHRATCVIQHEGSSVNESRQEGPHVHAIVLSPDERHAYAADLGIDKVMIYAFDPTSGSLTPADPAFAVTAPGAGPRHLKFDPSGERAWLINELDNTFVSYTRDPESGALTEHQVVSALPDGHDGENFCADIQVRDGVVYGSNRGHDSIATASIRDDGTLDSVAHTPSGGAWPWNLSCVPDTNILLAANQRGDCVTSFIIDAGTGALAPTGHTVNVPKPVCLCPA